MNPLDLLASNFSADDLSIRFFQSILGPLFGIPFEDFAILGVLAGAINGFIMATAAIWLGWLTVTTIADGAYSGEIGGKTMHRLWGPLRVIMGFGFIVPLGSGFNLLQHGIAFIAMVGISFANFAWNQVVDGLLKTGTPTASYYDAQIEGNIISMMDIGACVAFANLSPSPDGSGSSQHVAVNIFASGNNMIVETNFTEDGRSRYGSNSENPCGKSIVSWPASSLSVGGDAVANILSGVVGDLETLFRSIEGQANRFVRSEGEVLRYINNGLARTDPPTRDEFILASTYLQAIGSRVSSQIYNLSKSDEKKDKFSNTIKNGGWVQAGSWYRMFTEESVRVNQSLQPSFEFTNPDWPLFRNFYKGIYDTNHYLEKYTEFKKSLLPPSAQSTIYQMNEIEREQSSNMFSEAFSLFTKALGFLTEFISDGITGGIDRTGQSVITAPLEAITGIGEAMTTTGLLMVGGGSITPLLVTVLENKHPLGWLASKGAGHIIKELSGFFVTVGIILLIPGLILYVIIPLLPSLYFLVAAIGWALMVMEAIIIAPLWALAHLRLDGSSFAGESAMRGYGVMITVVFRPVLIVGGFLMGIAAFGAAVNLAMPILGRTFMVEAGGEMMGPIVSLTSLVVMTFALFWVAEKSFSLIHVVPDNVSHWLPLVGGQPLGESDMRNNRSYAFAGIMASREVIGSGAGAVSKSIQRARGSDGKLGGNVSEGQDQKKS